MTASKVRELGTRGTRTGANADQLDIRRLFFKHNFTSLATDCVSIHFTFTGK